MIATMDRTTGRGAPAEKRRRAVGYIRVSTDDQAESGHSLDAQRAKVIGYAAIHEMTPICLIMDDGRSGKSLDRPGMSDVLAMVEKRTVDCVIVAKLDRLTRSVRDLGDLIERFDKTGVEFASVADNIDTATAGGRLVLNVMGSVAQWEREIIAERTTEALQHMRANGERVGRFASYGYRLDKPGEDGVQVADPHEQQGIRLIMELRRQRRTLCAISEELESRGYVGRKGQRLSPKVIRSIISRESKA